MKNHDVDALIPRPDGRAHALPPRGATWRSGEVKRRRGRDELAGRRGARRAERPAAERPRLGGQDRVHRRAHRVTTDASPAALWRVIEGIGGETGGTPTRCCGRSAAGWTGSSAASDSPAAAAAAPGWTSATPSTSGGSRRSSAGSLLRLRAEMKVPGLAWLELRGAPDGDGSRYDQRAVFFPQGLAGRLYWLAVLPFHGFIFAGMVASITAAAIAADAEARKRTRTRPKRRSAGDRGPS